ncbi:MAG: hypothetical protein ACI9SG_002597 [Maribacter sp.]
MAVLLFALMLFKVSSFHVYTHQDSATSDDIENCAICELWIENQHSELIFTPLPTSTKTVLNLETKEQVRFYPVVLVSSYLRFSFFGRPPPNSI